MHPVLIEMAALREVAEERLHKRIEAARNKDYDNVIARAPDGTVSMVPAEVAAMADWAKMNVVFPNYRVD